jgi:hypothetical protein
VVNAAAAVPGEEQLNAYLAVEKVGDTFDLHWLHAFGGQAILSAF